ncbi:unnamed protein product, partial [Staurois parvus]
MGHQASGHFWLDSGHRVKTGKAVGSESTGIGSSDWTAGIGSLGIRSFGSTAGTAVIWQGSGLRVNRHDRSTGSSGTGFVWLDSGHRVTRYDSGHWVTRSSGHLARQRAPDQVPDHLDQQRASSHTGLIGSSGWIRLIMLGRGIRLNAG